MTFQNIRNNATLIYRPRKRMSGEEDPKEAAKKEARSPQVQQLLRQFMTDGPKGNSPTYKENLEQALSNSCLTCDGFGTVGIAGKPPHIRSEEKCRDCNGSGKKQ